MTLWPVDPLIKVFQDDAPGPPGEAKGEAARGEHVSLQVAVRSDVAITGLRATVEPLRREGGDETLTPRAVRFVGYVHVDRPTQKPSRDQLRQPPADYPDPLLETEAMDVPPGRTQPLWVTVPVPKDAAPGVYRGVLRVESAVDGAACQAEQPLAVRIYPVTVDRTRLWVTQWFSMQWRHMDINPEPESEEYYDLMRRYARNMAEHRHNVARISPISLADFSVGDDGTLRIDFSRFDRWVTVFQEEGVIGRIEGGHIGGRKGGWTSDFVVQIREIVDGQVVARTADPDSPEADAFYAVFFPALVAHLKEKDWLHRYMQHLADEPIIPNIKSYEATAALTRKYGPELRTIEACHTKDLVGSIDIWVPQLDYLHKDFAHYRERQAAGDEVWFYTCVFPQGEYANRFIEQPLIKTQLLHWIHFRYGITGYLHWGYNHWPQDSPITHTTPPHEGPPYLPAGDAWIVYPGSDGPLDSIRFEAMRDGIVDHELLCMLAERDPEAAADIVSAHILDFDRYDTDVTKFRATRRDLLRRLSVK